MGDSMTINSFSKYILIVVFVMLGIVPRLLVNLFEGNQYFYITGAGYIVLITLSSTIYFFQAYYKVRDIGLEYVFDFTWVLGFYLYTNIVFFPLAFRAMLPYYVALLLAWMLYLVFKIIWKEKYIQYWRIALKLIFLVANVYLMMISAPF